MSGTTFDEDVRQFVPTLSITRYDKHTTVESICPLVVSPTFDLDLPKKPCDKSTEEDQSDWSKALRKDNTTGLPHFENLVPGIQPTMERVVTVQATCLTLAAISVDRYCAIVHPISSIPYRSPAIAMTISGCIWISSFLLSLPIAISARLETTKWMGNQILCREDWTLHEEKVYNVYIVVNSYIIPLLVSATFYGLIVRSLRARVIDYDGQNNEGEQHALRRQKRVTRMVAVVVLLFALCWLPIHVLNMSAVFDQNFPLTYTTLCIKMFAHCLSYANSAANPFVYGFMGEHFRQNFKKAFPRCFMLNRVGAVAPNVAQLATIEQQLGDQAGASIPAETEESDRRHKHFLQPAHLNLPVVET
ncbi:receptor [Branchiostoma belcheri]|nr:receptor [Branchiostoma belcheri]